MQRFVLNADKVADVIVRWGGLYVLLSALFSWLSKNAPVLGALTWPEAILAGIAMALLTMLIASGSLALFRFFRPLQVPGKANAGASEGAGSILNEQVAQQLDYVADQIQQQEAAVRKLQERSERFPNFDLIEAMTLASTVLRAERAREEIANHWQGLQSGVGQIEETGLARSDWRDRFGQLQERLIEVSRWISELSTEEVNLASAPEFSRNPDRPVPGDDAINDPTCRQEFRCAYHQVRGARAFLEDFIQQRWGEFQRVAAPLKPLILLVSR